MSNVEARQFLNAGRHNPTSEDETPMQTHPLKYLQLLSEKYPSIQAASTAIINFSALLQLPKGTEHFLSDIHGEHEAFQHVVRNGAGSILRKIDEMFSNSMSKSERRNLATLIYYPEMKAPLMLNSVPDKDEWSRLALVRLVKFSRRLSSKYRRERSASSCRRLCRKRSRNCSTTRKASNTRRRTTRARSTPSSRPAAR
jgi:fructose-1,6-bisphosphatase